MSCGPAVRGALAECEGVHDESIETDINEREATIYTDPEKFDLDNTLAKLEEINFPATVKE